MKKTTFYIIVLLSLSYLTSCTSRVKHDDPFYYYDSFSTMRIPLIEPIEVKRLNSSSPWDLSIIPGIYIELPETQGSEYHHIYFYAHVRELEKFAVKDDIILAYSSFIDKETDVSIQDNYYHWFVSIPEKEITKGFHTEDEFLEYIQTLGIDNPDWQNPDEVFTKFRITGCLEWIPDCE